MDISGLPQRRGQRVNPVTDWNGAPARVQDRWVSERTVVCVIKPGSRKGPAVEVADDGTLTLFVREPAIDGKANKAALALLAEHLGVPKSAVRLVAGQTSRIKRFSVG